MNPEILPRHPKPLARRRSLLGFSLVELLVACSVLTLILVIMLSIVNHVSGLWSTSNARVESFQSARVGFENLSRMLSQATLGTYWDYGKDASGNPTRFLRKSELHFITDHANSLLGNGAYFGNAVFFQAPAQYNPGSTGSNQIANGNLSGLLNACGFYIEYASDKDKSWLPDHIASSGRQRFRLMQWLQPAADLSIYSPGVSGSGWIPADFSATALPAAENVFLLLIVPEEPEPLTQATLPDRYLYDSRENATADPQPITAHQLPPVLRVIMVAMDESSAERLGDRLKSTVEESLEGLFEATPSTHLHADLKELEERLTDSGIHYRIFSSAIPMTEAKWSPQP